MANLNLQEIVNKYYKNTPISNTAEIHSFTMDREYFLDVFEIRYEISIDLKRPIKGLKETLNSFKASSNTEIQSTSIKDYNINIIIYTDLLFKKVYGILDFSEK